MSTFKIFIIEDDELYGNMLKHHLSRNPDYEVKLFLSGSDCLKNLYKNPSVISLDYRLPDMSGHKVLKNILKYNSETPVIIVSGQEDITTAVELLKEGAYDYFVKDDNTKDRLWNVINKIKENFELKQEISELKEEIGKKYEFRKIIKGNSPAIKQIFGLIEKAINSNILVSLTGETGTGKELVAKAIHYNTPRGKQTFVAINVSAIPKELIESELFGHEKGAFTGADKRKLGRFELATNGTIFLDEIGDVSPATQAKLLRVLQNKEIMRVGGEETITVDVRTIAATNRDLEEQMKNGAFREDLYYRLNVFPIFLPSLRERKENIPDLIVHF